MDEKTKRKIQSLSLKTVANGATVSEAEAAKRLLDKLIGTPYRQNKTQNNVNLSKFMELWPSGEPSYDELIAHAPEIDWDIVASKRLNNYEYYEYLKATTNFWDRRYGVVVAAENRLTDEKYRTLCAKEFYNQIA